LFRQVSCSLYDLCICCVVTCDGTCCSGADILQQGAPLLLSVVPLRLQHRSQGEPGATHMQLHMPLHSLVSVTHHRLQLAGNLTARACCFSHARQHSNTRTACSCDASSSWQALDGLNWRHHAASLAPGWAQLHPPFRALAGTRSRMQPCQSCQSCQSCQDLPRHQQPAPAGADRC
jgi:hypothetical protein